MPKSLICCFASLLIPLTVEAGLVGLRFTGNLSATTSLFGETVSPANAIRGHVVYDSDADAVGPPPGCSGCNGYLQSPPAQFQIEVGSLTARYDHFLTTVINDGPGIVPPALEDVISFGRATSTNGQQSIDLIVNGVAQPLGALTLGLASDASLFSSPVLPNDIDPADFPFVTLVLSEGVSFIAVEIFSGDIERFDVVAGDYDLDEAVTTQDFDVWRSSYSSPISLVADGNGDGVINAADYTVWRDAASQSSVATPEPTGAACCMTALFASAFWRPRDESLR